MYLADVRGGYRALCFDLDGSVVAARADLAVLRGWLADAGITPLVVASGGLGRWHVWVTVAGTVPDELVAEIAAAASAQLPTLDTAPLRNPRSGCVRPPGAPHRYGGRATVAFPAAPDSALALWATGHPPEAITRLAQIVSAEAPTLRAAPGRPRAVDDDGYPYLTGPRRPLPPATAAAVDQPLAAGDDASARLWRVLLGAVAARWHHRDAAALAARGGGAFEHLRTTPGGGGRRRRRPAAVGRELLARQWTRAVSHVAALPADAGSGDDPDFRRRADTLAAAVQTWIGRADAAVGYWNTAGGPMLRRILDAHLHVHLHAAQPVISLSVRRLAEIAGCSAAQAHRVRHQLVADGWLAPAGDPDGPLASLWTLPPLPPAERSTPELATHETQADPPLTGRDPGVLRLALLTTLTRRLQVTSHPTFTPVKNGGLGAAAATVLVLTPTTGGAGVLEIAGRSGRPPDTVIKLMQRLESVGLVSYTTGPAPGWRRITVDLDAAALALGTDEIPLLRRQRHADEQLLWRWWCDEQRWMRCSRAAKRKPDPGPGQELLPVTPLFGLSARNRLGPMPRDADGRVSWRRARERIQRRRRPASAPPAAA